MKHDPECRLDPRTGIVCFLAVLVFTVLLPPDEPLWKTGALSLILFAGGMAFSSPALFWKKFQTLTLILIPLMIFIVSVSLIYSKETHSRAIFQAGQISLRALVVVLADLAFILNQKTEDLLAALSRMRVPAVIVALLSSGLRYSHILSSEAAGSLRARLSREKCKRPVFERLKITGLILEKIFWRAADRSQRVYAGMLSRGFDGNLYFNKTFRMRTVDMLTVAIMLTVLLFLAGL